MVKLRIENKELEAPDGWTVLEAAIDAGFTIPTLCHKKGMPHYSSCMVCMVKDRKTNGFLPSCSAMVQDGMDIDITGDEVIALRNKAIELLLSEHRAECEAPCRVVCPGGYNIPLLNRLLASGDIKGAAELSVSEITAGEIICKNCPGYCENACRRKKADLPVSIRNLKLFISQNYKNEITSPEIRDNQKTGKPLKRFTSHIGKLEASELKEWLKECQGNETRFREISDPESASLEAQNCMHCDCRAADNCRLRDLAEMYHIKDPRGKLVNSPIVKKMNTQTGLIFENAKCIKCGLCVRLCEQTGEEPGLCFINRGFVSIISEPLTVDFENILKTKSKAVIEICPTGALSQF